MSHVLSIIFKALIISEENIRKWCFYFNLWDRIKLKLSLGEDKYWFEKWMLGIHKIQINIYQAGHTGNKAGRDLSLHKFLYLLACEPCVYLNY